MEEGKNGLSTYKITLLIYVIPTDMARLKKNAKARASKNKSNMLATGGGVSEATVFDGHEGRILSMLAPEQIAGIQTVNESPAIFHFDNERPMEVCIMFHIFFF